MPRSERDAVKLGRGVKVGGHRLGEGPRSAVLERGRIEVVKAQQVGQGNKPGAQSRDGLGGGHLGVTPVGWSGWCESPCGPRGWAGRLHHHDNEEATHA